MEDIIAISQLISKLVSTGQMTLLCKKLFLELREKNFVPVYVFDKTYTYYGKMESRITEAYSEQYESVSFEEVDKKRVVPIIDNFHFAKKKEKHISDLAVYSNQIIIVDDIFNLNLEDEYLTNLFTYFKIDELNPLLRNEIISNWVQLSDKKKQLNSNENSVYKTIDQNTELINATLGKIFGKGIMPAYPFFLLSIISTYETFAKPLDEDITSQGYCYQAFIYMYLRKQGVKNEDIDTYINFLDEFAFLFFSKRKSEISLSEFQAFMKAYLEKYNMPIKQDVLIEKLIKSNIIAIDNFNNYRFPHKYLYYFFVAKYLADHMNDNKEVNGILNEIINNLHKDENAYIAVFVTHHSKNEKILEEIILNACCLFDEYKPSKLLAEDLNFFNQQVEHIVQAALPSPMESPKAERTRRLSAQKEMEENDPATSEQEEDHYDELEKELRRAIKTVEVIGSIIKNRAGSLNKETLRIMFEEAMHVHFRILTSFFELIKTEKEQEKIINFIFERLQNFIENKRKEMKRKGQREREIPRDDLVKISKSIFWNLNFFTIFGLVNKIITSLGSEKLTTIVEDVCDKENTPASYLIKHGILMWYNKNLQADTIAQRIREDDFSDITKRIMTFLIVDHCAMHKINYKDRQRIEQKFNIPSRKLLECQK